MTGHDDHVVWWGIENLMATVEPRIAHKSRGPLRDHSFTHLLEFKWTDSQYYIRVIPSRGGSIHYTLPELLACCHEFAVLKVDRQV